MFQLSVLLLLVVRVVYTKPKAWSYEERTGPEYWGKLAASNAVCAQGNEQSPINIVSSQVIGDKKIGGKQITYMPTTFTLHNNGHTIQANAITEKNRIVVEGKEYKLAQFHFHTPSEHQLNVCGVSSVTLFILVFM